MATACCLLSGRADHTSAAHESHPPHRSPSLQSTNTQQDYHPVPTIRYYYYALKTMFPLIFIKVCVHKHFFCATFYQHSSVFETMCMKYVQRHFWKEHL